MAVSQSPQLQFLIKQTAKKPENAKLRAGAVCAVGWEPNPDFTPVLAKLEEAYNRCGWKVNDDDDDDDDVLAKLEEAYNRCGWKVVAENH